jgi:lycopene beta-cyclase
LQSGLLALALRHHQPHARILLLERGATLGGNHTWSFHTKDVSASAAAWVAPLIESRWPRYDVRIGKFCRTVELEYASVSSAHFARVVDDAVTAQSGSQIHTSTTAEQVSLHHVTAADGRCFRGRLVVDNRGPSRDGSPSFTGGYQKFWGFEIELPEDWPDVRPVIMDDSVDQRDGFRFLYTLPFTRRRVLVEDTRFSNSAELHRAECIDVVQGYLRRRNVTKWRIVREEHGVLPMPTNADYAPRGPRSDEEVLAGGYAGGWFHAATGYSFPLAAAFADRVATVSVERVPAAVKDLAASHRWRNRYGRFLNRLLFELVKPKTRYQIFRRFYRVLAEPRIARFYAHRFRCSDAARIVVGIPPGGLRPFRFLSSYVGSLRGQKRSRGTEAIEPPRKPDSSGERASTAAAPPPVSPVREEISA